MSAAQARSLEPATSNQPPPAAVTGLRATVQTAAKRFKSTWVELGKLLVQVRDEALYTEWGFETLEAYCLKELHIRKETAWKLTRSFSFLNKHEPKAMREEDIQSRAPAFEVVEVLADAEERGQLSAHEYRDLRDSIWNPQRPVSELRREFSERFPRPVTPEGDAARLRRWAHTARRLAGEMGSTRKVPSSLMERASALAEDIEELLEEFRED